MSVRPRLTRALAVAALAPLMLVAGLPADAATRTPTGRGTYVALGDSYASGEGLAPYEADAGSCDRSRRKSYPERLSQLGPRRFDRLTSAACSGATTGLVVATQLDALDAGTRTVTLTVGGNDVGFAPVLLSCAYSPVPELNLPRRGCQVQAPLVDAATAFLGGPMAPPVNGRLPLVSVLAEVAAQAPDAQILVSGYPQLFGATDADCRISDALPVFIAADDVAWIRQETTALNAAVAAGVAQARAGGLRVRYVDATRTFDGHGLCDRHRSWINGLVVASLTPPTPSPATFHPTATGQWAYAAAFLLPSRSSRS